MKAHPWSALPSRFVAVDVETTGFKNSDRVIAFAAIFFEAGQEVKALTTLINPECRIPAAVTKLTGIHPEDVRDAPLFRDVASTVLKCLKGKLLVGHSLAFDVRMLRGEFARLGREADLEYLETRDTLPWARDLLEELPSKKLASVADALGVPLVNAHSADGDARATGLVALALDGRR